MWGHILNIHLSELLSTKSKKSRINELQKKKKKKKSASQYQKLRINKKFF